MGVKTIRRVLSEGAHGLEAPSHHVPFASHHLWLCFCSYLGATPIDTGSCAGMDQGSSGSADTVILHGQATHLHPMLCRQLRTDASTPEHSLLQCIHTAHLQLSCSLSPAIVSRAPGEPYGSVRLLGQTKSALVKPSSAAVGDLGLVGLASALLVGLEEVGN